MKRWGIAAPQSNFGNEKLRRLSSDGRRRRQMSWDGKAGADGEENSGSAVKSAMT